MGLLPIAPWLLPFAPPLLRVAPLLLPPAPRGKVERAVFPGLSGEIRNPKHEIQFDKLTAERNKFESSKGGKSQTGGREMVDKRWISSVVVCPAYQSCSCAKVGLLIDKDLEQNWVRFSEMAF